MFIITHRGLDLGVPDFFAESSFQAFKNHLKRGFGIEFDPNFTKDGRIVIFHDKNLKRATRGKDKREIKDIEGKEVEKIRFSKGERLCFLGELLDMIRANKASLSALHFKGRFQKRRYLSLLKDVLKGYRDCLGKILIFDLKPKTARYFKREIPQLRLAPSVAYGFDIERYNSYVGDSLISIEEAIRYRKVYDWVWLDEWDLNDRGGKKKFYTKKVFNLLKRKGFKIALVTPELHATSPGLLGGETHQDAESQEKLFRRIKEIIKLRPEAICTDYPDKVRSICY